MADLSTKSIKDAAPDMLRGNMSPSDARTIRMIVTIGDRRVGVVYVVDSSLAQHYCEVIKVAEYVKDEPVKPAEAEPTDKKEPEPEPITDRAMRPPPRGRRK